MDTTPLPPLGAVYNFKQCAVKLGISPRSLQALIKKHPYYSRNGSKYLFSEDDISKLWEAMRGPAEEQRRRNGVPTPDFARLHARAVELTTRKNRPKKIILQPRTSKPPKVD